MNIIYESEETNNNYILYTDNTKDEIGNIKVLRYHQILKCLFM